MKGLLRVWFSVWVERIKAAFRALQSLQDSRGASIIEVLQEDRSVSVMGQLIYMAVTSLDGYVEDQEGHIDWSAPEEELFSFITDLVRPISTYLYGRGMYEAMLYWETAQPTPGQPGSFSSFSDFKSIWLEAQKVVYSRTLESVSSARTRVERDFDAQSVRHLKDTSDHDMTVGGSNLADQAIRLGLVDELRIFVLPVILGGGKNWLPSRVRLDLELLDMRRFPHGSMYLSYRPVSSWVRNPLPAALHGSPGALAISIGRSNEVT